MTKKFILLIIIAIGYMLNCVGQISTVKIGKVQEGSKVMTYDSTINFLKENVKLYIGQDLYVKGVTKDLQETGYDGFFININDSLNSRENVYKPKEPSNLEKSLIESVKIINKQRISLGMALFNSGYMPKSEYDSLVGKYFTVLDVIKHPKSDQDSYMYGDKYYLKLKDKSLGDIVFYEYDNYSFPFIVVGYFQKLKNKFLGKKYVFASQFIKGEINVKTGKEIAIYVGDKWKCTDVSIEEINYNISAMLADSHGQIIPINVDYLVDIQKYCSIFSVKDADRYVNKFGLTTWNMILNGKVKIGWTKEMCRLSWGEPDDINSTITSRSKREQWVFSNNYLYFDNEILTTIQ